MAESTDEAPEEATPTAKPKKHKGGLGAPWAPGQSGNPGGRAKKLPELREACEQLTPKILKRLEKLIDTGSGKDAVAASKLVLSYAYGQPTTVIAGDPERPPVGLDLLTPKLLELVDKKDE